VSAEVKLSLNLQHAAARFLAALRRVDEAITERNARLRDAQRRPFHYLELRFIMTSIWN
jgi:hypothetical protein